MSQPRRKKAPAPHHRDPRRARRHRIDPFHASCPIRDERHIARSPFTAAQLAKINRPFTEAELDKLSAGLEAVRDDPGDDPFADLADSPGMPDGDEGTLVLPVYGGPRRCRA